MSFLGFLSVEIFTARGIKIWVVQLLFELLNVVFQELLASRSLEPIVPTHIKPTYPTSVKWSFGVIAIDYEGVGSLGD